MNEIEKQWKALVEESKKQWKYLVITKNMDIESKIKKIIDHSRGLLTREFAIDCIYKNVRLKEQFMSK